MSFSLFFLTLCLSSSFSGTLPYLTCLKDSVPWRTILSGTVPASPRPPSFNDCFSSPVTGNFHSSVQQIPVKFLLCLKTHDVGEITEQAHVGIGPRRFSISSSVLFWKLLWKKPKQTFWPTPNRYKMLTHSKWKWSHSVMSDSATPWTIAYQSPSSMGFSRLQEYWGGWPFPSSIS